MEKFIIAIPSYKRCDKQETLNYLNKMGIPKSRIYIFVQTKQDYVKYQKNNSKCNIIYAPANYVAQARNNILNALVDKYDVLMMDDDIKSIYKVKDGKLKSIDNILEFERIINGCFQYTKATKAKLFGFYPVPNEFFMKDDVSTKVTVNTVLGFVKGFELRVDTSYIAKEDLELCGRILNDGGKVIRFNYLTAKAKHRTNDGGCKDVWKSKENEKAVLRLVESYPTIFAKHRTKDNEVRVIMKDEKLDTKDVYDFR